MRVAPSSLVGPAKFQGYCKRNRRPESLARKLAGERRAARVQALAWSRPLEAPLCRRRLSRGLEKEGEFTLFTVLGKHKPREWPFGRDLSPSS